MTTISLSELYMVESRPCLTLAPGSPFKPTSPFTAASA